MAARTRPCVGTRATREDEADGWWIARTCVGRSSADVPAGVKTEAFGGTVPETDSTAEAARTESILQKAISTILNDNG